MLSYLKKCHNTEMVFDLSDKMVQKVTCERKDWVSSEFGNLLEEMN